MPKYRRDKNDWTNFKPIEDFKRMKPCRRCRKNYVPDPHHKAICKKCRRKDF